MKTDSRECWRCHVTSADRAVSDGSIDIGAMCFDCLWIATELAGRGRPLLVATLFAHGPAPLGDHGSATIREDAHQV